MAEKKTRKPRKKAQVLLKEDLKTVGPGVRKQTTNNMAAGYGRVPVLEESTRIERYYIKGIFKSY